MSDLKHKESDKNSSQNRKMELLPTLMLCAVLFCGVCAADMGKYEQIKKAGKVSVVYEASRNLNRKGLTEFKYIWKTNFNYNYNYREHNGKIFLTVKVKTAINPVVSHHIYMPEEGQGQPWHNQLLAHEYDHVCISMDQRPTLLLSHLTSQFTLKDLPLNSKREITDKFITSQINKRLHQYQKAVEELIQANYRLLDHNAVSSHGMKKIANRELFFRKLYGAQNLANNKLKYLKKVQPFLKSRQYKNAKTHYLTETKKQKIKSKPPQHKPVKKTIKFPSTLTIPTPIRASILELGFHSFLILSIHT